MPSEKRQTLRIAPFVVPCRIVAGSRRIPAYLTDLSAKGARVSCDVEPPASGESVIVEVRFGRQVRHSRLPAQVKWTQPPASGGGHTFGLTFRGVTAEEQRVVDSVVEEFQRRASMLA